MTNSKKAMSVKSWVSELAKYRFLLKPTLIFAAIFAVGLLALIRADFNYYDDYGRANEGYQYWEQFGRYVSNWGATFLHTNQFLAEISPLTQLVACLIMGLASTIAVYAITGVKEFKVRHYLAGIPIGLSPYFMECYAYKFDAPYMALSVLASILPFLFWDCKHKAVFPVVAFGSALVMCMTYQAANGIFFVLLLLMELKSLLGSSEKLRKVIPKTLKSLLLRALPYAAGMLCFRFLIMPSYDGGYAATTLPPLAELPQTVIGHLQFYAELIWSDFNMIWTILVGLVLVVFLIFLVVRAHCSKVLAAIAGLLFLLYVAVGSFGIYPALEAPLFSAHAMYGITVAFGFICIATVELVQVKYATLLRLPVFLLAWCFFVYAFIYGNVLSRQQDYANFRLGQTITALNQDNILTDETKTVSVLNDPDFAPSIRSSIARYPLLGRSVYKVYYGFDVWGTYKLLNYYDLGVEVLIGNDVTSPEDNPCYQNDECEVIETYYDKIYYNDEAILVEIKR